MTSVVGGRATIQREGAPKIQGSSGNPWRSVAKPSRQAEFLRKGSEEKASHTYSPRGDFKSVVKCMEVKLRCTSVDRESRLCVQILWVFSYPFSLFFHKGISQTFTLNLNLHFILNKIPTCKHTYILIAMASAKTVKVFFFHVIFSFFSPPSVFHFENVYTKTLWRCAVAEGVCAW